MCRPSLCFYPSVCLQVSVYLVSVRVFISDGDKILEESGWTFTHWNLFQVWKSVRKPAETFLNTLRFSGWWISAGRTLIVNHRLIVGQTLSQHSLIDRKSGPNTTLLNSSVKLEFVDVIETVFNDFSTMSSTNSRKPWNQLLTLTSYSSWPDLNWSADISTAVSWRRLTVCLMVLFEFGCRAASAVFLYSGFKLCDCKQDRVWKRHQTSCRWQ